MDRSRSETTTKKPPQTKAPNIALLTEPWSAPGGELRTRGLRCVMQAGRMVKRKKIKHQPVLCLPLRSVLTLAYQRPMMEGDWEVSCRIVMKRVWFFFLPLCLPESIPERWQRVSFQHARHEDHDDHDAIRSHLATMSLSMSNLARPSATVGRFSIRTKGTKIN